jgi:hypothetical protein
MFMTGWIISVPIIGVRSNDLVAVHIHLVLESEITDLSPLPDGFTILLKLCA